VPFGNLGHGVAEVGKAGDEGQAFERKSRIRIVEQFADHPPENVVEPVIGLGLRFANFLRLAPGSRRVSCVAGKATASAARDGWFRDSEALKLSAFLRFKRADPSGVCFPVFPVPVGLSGLV
jgi:hypothetical protein